MTREILFKVRKSQLISIDRKSLFNPSRDLIHNEKTQGVWIFKSKWRSLTETRQGIKRQTFNQLKSNQIKQDTLLEAPEVESSNLLKMILSNSKINPRDQKSLSTKMMYTSLTRSETFRSHLRIQISSHLIKTLTKKIREGRGRSRKSRDYKGQSQKWLVTLLLALTSIKNL